jgi:glycosidase
MRRSGSEVSVDWNAPTSGRWVLRTTAGDQCAAGEFAAGSNHLSFRKVATSTDVEFQVSYGEGRPIEMASAEGLRQVSNLPKPEGSVAIYQVPVRTYFARGSGNQFTGTLDQLTDARLAELAELGVDYVWLTGVLEQASLDQTDPDVVKGDAGSYYAIYDNWDVSAQIGGLAAFEQVVQRAHSHGLRVIIDFVANHTARFHKTDIVCKTHLDFGIGDNTGSFFRNSNNYYYIQDSTFTPPLQNGAPGVDGVFDQDIFMPNVQLERPARVTGNDIISANPAIYDWFETVKLNYGFDIQNRRAEYEPMPRTWHQMLDIARYWVEKGVDGFRVDFAHAVPIEFWRYFATELKAVNPNIFLLAEAYESDHRMRLPGFSYESFLATGFDSVYNSELYWEMRNQAKQPGNFRSVRPNDSPLQRPGIFRAGQFLTHYMENHDEVRLASRHFAPWVGERGQRAELGLSYSAYLALLPGHFLIHGGQEFQEDASVFGRFAGDNGRTSIFDFVFQSLTRKWFFDDERPGWMVDFRERYRELIELKKQTPFNLVHSEANPSFIDLDRANWYKDQSRWVGAYVRHGEGESYVVVINSDPFASHTATIHFTSQDGVDELGALRGLGIERSSQRYVFTEVFSRKGWQPSDPALPGAGIPGDALYRSGGIPSGLHLGDIPASTTMIFRVTATN